jgi:charged multivesicular body protein 5
LAISIKNLFKIDEADLEAELDALGDELQLDMDSSYLDEAITAPNAPTKEPTASTALTDHGVPVDEYGLPRIPAT